MKIFLSLLFLGALALSVPGCSSWPWKGTLTPEEKARLQELETRLVNLGKWEKEQIEDLISKQKAGTLTTSELASRLAEITETMRKATEEATAEIHRLEKAAEERGEPWWQWAMDVIWVLIGGIFIPSKGLPGHLARARDLVAALFQAGGRRGRGQSRKQPRSSRPKSS